MNDFKGYKINNWFLDDPLDLGGIKLIQAGRYYCSPSTVISTAMHSDFYELTIVTDGKGIIVTNDKEIPVSKNDIYVSFPFDRHGIIASEDDPLKFDHLAFAVENELYADKLKMTAAKFYDPDLRIISDPRINYLTVTIVGEFNKKKDFFKAAVRNAVENVIIYILRAFNEKDSDDFAENADGTEILCNRIMNYIDTNVYAIETLKDLSAITHYNYNYLSTIFKKTTSLNLRDYLIDRKLEVADMLIKEGKLPICRIAEKLNYSSGAAFSKAYKRKYGISPGKIK